MDAVKRKLEIHPSNAVWTQGNLWYAQITVWYAQITVWLNDDEGSVILKKEFLYEQEAMKWRATFIEMLRNAEVTVQEKENSC